LVVKTIKTDDLSEAISARSVVGYMSRRFESFNEWNGCVLCANPGFNLFWRFLGIGEQSQMDNPTD